ncbi:MAG: prepilin-type N-terminal cleavage/methylation domain-containing protein [Sutterellaceae bacterium]|nr:prepilin-type N-terminal cleavage/methylation domain-containing protein [Burkholderiaceae bacterium]MCX7900733.1 prepilin-type N-terminal cleavage/methylation domain-containing protein [Burkholderiaceae bacterium]MDW8429777.1 prepilin-type N-terminal cleavage/methylation domain-containing protein [Sutterellaceae bacterium]
MHRTSTKSHLTGWRRSAAGFSLVEIAIASVIVALLLGGLLALTATHTATQRVRDTEQLLAQARQALLGFAAVNGRLPCPAAPGLPSGAAGAGVEQTPTATGCTGGQIGVLPWVTLGLPELDAWGRRFTYRVTALHARTVMMRLPTQFGCTPPPATVPTQAAFALCSPGDNEVRVASAGASLVTGAVAVIISHGANGFGARLPSGATMPPSPDADEAENHDTDNIAVQRVTSASFDDLVIWVPVALLAQSMLQAGRLP